MENIAEIERCEEQLREALLNSDVGLLDSLLGDDLIFTNQDGMRLTKADDIAAHQSGLLAIETLSQQGERIIRRLGDTAIVCLTIEVAGKYAGQPFRGTFAYSRVWRRDEGRWRIELAHCSPSRATG